jgi:hypothetical protein
MRNSRARAGRPTTTIAQPGLPVFPHCAKVLADRQLSASPSPLSADTSSILLFATRSAGRPRDRTSTFHQKNNSTNSSFLIESQSCSAFKLSIGYTKESDIGIDTNILAKPMTDRQQPSVAFSYPPRPSNNAHRKRPAGAPRIHLSSCRTQWLDWDRPCLCYIRPGDVAS